MKERNCDGEKKKTIEMEERKKKEAKTINAP